MSICTQLNFDFESSGIGHLLVDQDKMELNYHPYMTDQQYRV